MPFEKLKLYVYRPQRGCGKVMFLHVSVILFTGGVAGRPPWQVDTPSLPLWADTPRQADTASLGLPLQWTVRILLVCILVFILVWYNG